jgi:hypothetical protein
MIFSRRPVFSGSNNAINSMAAAEHRSHSLSRFNRLFKYIWDSNDTISKFEDLDEHFVSLGPG